MSSLAILALAAIHTAVAMADEGSADLRMLQLEAVVPVNVETAWKAWATEEGLRFVSAQSNVDLRIGGPYELFLDLPPDDAGKRGSEGSRVLAWVPGRMLAFTWTFPPSIPNLRQSGETTQVVVFFDPIDEAATRVRLYQHGWREGDDWDRGYAYFESAWAAVLERFRSAMTGPDRGQRAPTE